MKTPALILLVILAFTGCNNSSVKKKTTVPEKGTYSYDRQFLKKYNNDVIELRNGNSALLLVAAYQGRVMTSTLDGKSSFGWINYDLISSGKREEHINIFGGEDRFWIGPEGGQFSIFFEKGKEFVFDNWYVPAELDTEAFNVVKSSGTSATFARNMHLKNYSGTRFNLNVQRSIEIMDKNSVQQLLGIDAGKLNMVAYRSSNTMKNTGDKVWTKETGLLSIWLLGMFKPSDNTIIVIPVKPGNEKELGPVVNDDYFGKISDDRLKVKGNTVFFKGDGKSRGKIGIPPLRTTGYMGSYDAGNKILTILKCPLPENVTDYINSAWKLQDDPFKGDAYNAYNDGPLQDGSLLGPFYELETSSPALALKPGEEYTHSQVICHFAGSEQELNAVAEKLLGVSLKDITDSGL
jgi:hypothetical protein